MKPEEAIEIIKVAIAEVEWNYPLDYALAFEDAIEVLEMQIPKKPIYKETDNIYGALRRTCSVCGDVVMVSPAARRLEKYCRYCGCRFEEEEKE